jgi:hypothetical protein
VEHLDVVLHGLAGADGDHGLALVVNVKHQLFRFRARISEDVLKDVRHIGHQVHRIVPDDRHPRLVRHRLVR